MRIVIDMQGAQGSNMKRGIGRYTLSFAQAIVRNRGDHEVFLALNGLFADTIEPIRAAFDDLLPQENIRVWESLEPVCHISNENDWRRRSAELVREAFLASFKPDIVLVSSLFEGLVDDAVTSIGKLSCTVPTAVILYDLIPLIQRQPYLENPVVEAWYENKLDHLRRADLLLAISESSRQEGIRYLGFPAETCVNISTAVDPQFKPQQIDRGREQEVRQRYGLDLPFVMYTGGIDHRKNIEGLIRGYAKLPKPLRASHQLAIICSIQPSSRTALETLAKEQGLKANELVLTGFVPEPDLLALYNLCKAFVFPSWHEGFGLPALEAMSCGRAVIAANTSSLPEVIGWDDALFDPMNDASIAEKLAQVLTDDYFRSQLEQHGLAQAKRFSWDVSAQRAIAAIEAQHVKKFNRRLSGNNAARRPKLAFISPLPPERSGISDYSADLLPELSKHYDIDVILAQDTISDAWISVNCQARSVEWFRINSDRYERVLYHFGNSSFHRHMFSLLEDIPGVVVLHDFYLPDVIAYLEGSGLKAAAWANALYQSHGYRAVQHRFHSPDPAEMIACYPCNIEVLQNSLGVIVHSENTRRLANRWYGEGLADDWAAIPLLRVPEFKINRTEARRQLGLDDNDFVVCSFGMVGPSKLSHRLLNVWLTSILAKQSNCKLIFVGEQKEEYGARLVSSIQQSGLSHRIHITGWADVSTFKNYLAAADVGVQLRTLSRGETSAAALDCMNYGLATIVNANGSMMDLPDEAVWKLTDDFADSELLEALETLWRNPSHKQLGEKAREFVMVRHAPRICADQYHQAIEAMYRTATTNVHSLAYGLGVIGLEPADPNALVHLASVINQSIPPTFATRQIFVDISELANTDHKTGIQRVVRSILQELLNNPPPGYRVEPVYAKSGGHCYRYARQYTLRALNCPDSFLCDEEIEFRNGDIFLGLDLQHGVTLTHETFYRKMRDYGVRTHFVVYDLLPIQFPHFWEAKHKIDEVHHRWLSILSKSDGAICISKAVADELTEWFELYGPVRMRPFKISWFHLGADINASMPSGGVPLEATEVLKQIGSGQSFLMVGTVEPRKAHAQTLAAFEQLWAVGTACNLIIVGRQGWLVDAFAQKLRNHPQLGRQLFWLEGISDEYLEKIYAACDCLIASSEGEGFGLPLIEAAQHKLSIIARDIPVFREVAGDHAYYFNGLEPQDLADTVRQWLALHAEGKAPSSTNMPWLTWRQSTEQLLAQIV